MSKGKLSSAALVTLMAAMLLCVHPAFASVFYDYTVLGKTGDTPINPSKASLAATLSSIGPGVSINDLGAAAFQGNLSDGTNGVFFADGVLPPTLLSGASTSLFSQSVQINNQNIVTSRQPIPGGSSAIRNWLLSGAFNNVATGSNTVAADFAGLYPLPTINNLSALEVTGGTGNQDGICNPGETCEPQAAFGAFAGTALTDTLATLKKAGAGIGSRTYNTRPLTSPLVPQIADTGEVVLRANISSSESEIRVYQYDLTSSETIAAAPTNFSVLGRAPGISEDGQIVVFYGHLSEPGANTINASQGGLLDQNCPFKVVNPADPVTFPVLPILKPGPGIFASVKTATKGRVILRIAGSANERLDPGESFQDSNNNGCWDAGEPITEPAGTYTALEADARVAVNSTHRDESEDKNRNGWVDLGQRAVTVAYMANMETNGTKRRLLTSRLNYFGSGSSTGFSPNKPGYFSVTRATVVATVGDIVGSAACASHGNEKCLDLVGLNGTISSLDWNDPLNNWDRGDVTFKMGLTTPEAQAVVKASPREVVYLNFSPASSFSLSGTIAVLLKGLSAPNIVPCPNANCPWTGNFVEFMAAAGRPDLNGDAMITNIVSKVQEQFDDMDRALSDVAADLPTPPGVSACPTSAGGPVPLRARVKVLGSNSTVAPTEGLVTTVYIGDGPHSGSCSSNACRIRGIAGLDLFNQNNKGSLNAPIDVIEPSILVLVDNIFRSAFTSSSDPNKPGTPIPLTADPSVAGYITQIQAERSISRTIAHELGHSFGLAHVRKDCNSLIMNLLDNDESRYEQKFGNQLIERAEFNSTGGQNIKADFQNAAKRLAFGIGSSREPTLFERNAPSSLLLTERNRTAYEILAVGPLASVVVVKAVLGLAREDDETPSFFDLGGGPLGSLLNRTIPLGSGDKIFLVASTTGTTIDVFSVNPSETNFDKIELDNPLLMMTEARIRSMAIDPSILISTPLVKVVQKTSGGIVEIGVAGSSAMVSSVTGDLDGDGDVDKNDIGIVLAAKGTVATGPNDPRDVDKDGQITILDARKLATMCTRLNCATQ